VSLWSVTQIGTWDGVTIARWRAATDASRWNREQIELFEINVASQIRPACGASQTHAYGVVV